MKKTSHHHPFAFVCIVIGWIAIFMLPLYVSLSYQDLEEEDPNTLLIFTWGDVFHPKAIQEFEKQYGVRVKLSYYGSNEEMLVKLSKTGGRGYDIIVPSDYAIPILRDAGFITPLNKGKLPIFSSISSRFLNHQYDPEGIYAIPFFWDVIGICYDSLTTSSELVYDWDAIFIKRADGKKIAMDNDPIESFNLASRYLHGNTSELSDAQIKATEQLLIRQKQWVGTYGAMRPDYFVALRNFPVGVSFASYVFLNQDKFPHLEFVLPNSFSFMSIEHLSILSSSKKQDLSHTFINYILSPQALALCCESYGFFPVYKEPLEHMNDVSEGYKEIFIKVENQELSLYFFENLVSEENMREFWARLKSISTNYLSSSEENEKAP